MILTATRYTAVLSMGLFLTCGEANAEDPFSAKDATNMQGVRIVLQYIDARPARLHENFNKLAAEALRQAWPCSN
jgi:hypothetical protein